MSARANEAAGTARVRRVVTGADEHGRSYIVSDGEAPNVFRSPTVSGFGASQVWATAPGPVSNEGATDAAGPGAEIPMSPALGGSVFRVADFPPDSAYENGGKDQLFADIGGDEARVSWARSRCPSASRPGRNSSPDGDRARSSRRCALAARRGAHPQQRAEPVHRLAARERRG